MSWLSDLIANRKMVVELPTRDGAGQEDVAPSSGKRQLPRFLGMAGDQRRWTTGPGDQVRSRMREAFTPSYPVMDVAMFAGRTVVLRTLIRAIEDQQLHVVVLGARGIGKTSTLHILAKVAEEAKYLVRYVSCGEESRFDDLFRSILRDIPLLYHGAYDPTADEVEEGLTFADLLPDGPLTVSAVTDVLVKISGTRVLILLDEFDRAEGHGFRRSVAELIKNLSDRASRVQIVIAGVAQNLNELIEHIPSIRRNVLGLLVPRMSDAEVAEIIHIGETTSGIDFSQEAIDGICAIAQGMPYLASLVSQHAGLFALEHDELVVSPAHVAEAICQTEAELAQRLAPTIAHKIERVIKAARDEELAFLALQSMQHGGRLVPTLADAAEYFNDNPRYLGEFCEATGLIAPLGGDADEAYAFVDAAIPVCIWVSLSTRLLLNTELEGAIARD